MIAGWLGVSTIAALSLFGLEVRVRDVAAVLFPAVASGLFAHGVRAREGRAPDWLGPAYTGLPARCLGAAGIALCLVLLCRPGAWGFVGEIAGDELSLPDLAASLAVTAIYTATAVASVPRWLRVRDLQASATAALFPVVVIPGIAIVHGGGSGRAAATWMLGYALAISGLLWRQGARANRPLLVAAARALGLLASAARFIDLPLG
jgi:hypothetical protein